MELCDEFQFGHEKKCNRFSVAGTYDFRPTAAGIVNDGFLGAAACRFGTGGLNSGYGKTRCMDSGEGFRLQGCLADHRFGA